jgi:hypothetical protein
VQQQLPQSADVHGPGSGVAAAQCSPTRSEGSCPPTRALMNVASAGPRPPGWLQRSVDALAAAARGSGATGKLGTRNCHVTFVFSLSALHLWLESAVGLWLTRLFLSFSFFFETVAGQTMKPCCGQKKQPTKSER